MKVSLEARRLTKYKEKKKEISVSTLQFDVTFCTPILCAPSVQWPLLKRSKTVFQDLLSLNVGQKYCRMLGAFCNTFDSIKLPFVIKIFVLSIFSGRFTQVLMYTLLSRAWIRHGQ